MNICAEDDRGLLRITLEQNIVVNVWRMNETARRDIREQNHGHLMHIRHLMVMTHC